MSKKNSSLTSLESDGNTSFLRAARAGHLDKVLEHLKSNIDINTSNANGLNALHLASKDGHVDVVEELLKRGATVDAATKKGNTALHIASLAGQEDVVKLLVNHGASVNVKSQNGFTPLYMAAQENHDNVVKYLLSNGANQSLATEDGFTPLAVAMQQGHDKVVTVLLENDTRGKVRLPALHIAAKKDDVKAAKLLLENDHNPDVTSKSGFTPLHIASHYGNESIANLLIQKKADVNYSAKHNITPLHVAAKWGKTNMVSLLLEKGANIESKTRDGLTPLHCAARSGHEQVVDMLLEREAPISCKTKNGLAPLHMAAQGDHVDAARILLYHRAPVDEVTVDYLTALHVAAHCGHVRVAKLLLDRQADPNARALNGFTPLHIACKKNRIKVVELLLKHGASISATTESGLTPLHVASFMGCMNIVIYLLQHDANPDVPTVRGETPLHLAARANQTDIIRILLRNGAQVDARAREQQTPLHIASRLGNVDIVMLLLQHGAKVDTTTKDMYTALHIASKEGHDEVAGVLIENGASLNATTKKGFTPLHLAAKYGNIKVAKLLLQKEAPVDAQGKNGVTPLHVASHYDHQNVALLLLDKGASPHATAKNGHTPLHIAAKKNQMDIANTLLEYGAKPNAESKAGFTPLHLSAQEGHAEMSSLLIEHEADTNQQAKNGLTPLHLCAQEDRVPVAEILVKNNAVVDKTTKAGYTPLHVASHYGQPNMVKFLLSQDADVKATTSIGYTPLHQAAQQGHTNVVNILLEKSADPNAITHNGQTPLNIAQKLGYITVIETLKTVTEPTSATGTEEKYKVVAPEAMHETFMSDSEEEGGEDTMLGDNVYRYLTADEMKSLGDDSLPIDVTRDERIDSNKMVTSADSTILPPQAIEDTISPQHYQNNYAEFIKKYTPDNVDIARHPINIGFLVSFLVDARGGAMRGCRHSGVRVIVPPRSAGSPTRITCRYVRPQRTPHPPPLMEGEALASRVLELGPVGAKFLGPVIIEVPHFAALRGKEREIVILRSDNGETWREHTVESSEDILNEVLTESFEAEDISQLEDTASGRITRILTSDFPQYFAVVSRIRQEVHAIGPEGGMVSSTVVPQVQAVFPQGALTKKIKVGLQAQPIDPELTAKLLGHGVAVSPVVTVEPRRRKFHKAITLSMPAPRAHSQGMINQYSGSTPTLRLLCSITGGTTRAQWEDVTGSTPLTFVNDCVSFTTTVSARFWLMDCRNISDATKMATELYREAIHVPFMAKFVVFAKRVDPLEARLRVFCMTDDKEDKTLEHQEHFTEVAKSRDVEVLEGKPQYIEFAGNLVPITKSGEQLQFAFRAFRENRLPFSVKVKDQHAEAIGRSLFMREPKVAKGEPPQQPICILNIVLPDDIVADTISLSDSEHIKRHEFLKENYEYYRPDPRLADMSNLLGEDWVPLATQLGLTSSEINVIKSEYPDSVAKQAQSMLRMWISQSSNRSQGNVLENALKRIGREDIIPQCLNEEHEIIKKEETVKYRIKKDISLEDRDIMKDSESIESLVHIDRKEDKSKKRGSYDKYSAEEKVVEEPSDEEDFNKTVAEKRVMIEKRLSVERTIPASQQRTEIVQEITSIKRQSIVEDKIAEVEQKRSSPSETKPIAEEAKTTISPIDEIGSTTVKTVTTESKPEMKTVTTDTKIEIKTIDIQPEVVSKTATIESKPDVKTSVKTIVSETRTTQEITTDITHKPETELLEGVTQRLETKRIIPKISADEDPKSPKLSKTPPPSPADFILREQAAAVQDWEASGKELQDESALQAQPVDAAKEGKPTPTTKTINEDNLDKINAASIDLEIRSKTNAFIDSERQTEPYEITETQTSPPAYKEDQKCEDKKQKKGFFGTLKTIVTKSFDYSDSDSEKSQKKSKKEKKKKSKDKKGKDTPETTIETSTKKPRLPTPPLERPEFENIPYAEASPTSEEPHFAIKEKANEIINEVEIAAISKINKASEHKIATKPPIPTKEKSFEVDLHKTIDQIGREILDEKTIVKHIPRLSKADISEDINAPILSEPPDHLIHYSQLDEYSQQLKITTHNLIQNEISFQGWSDDKYNIVKPIVRSSSQKTKRKHGKLFGFLGKKSSKEVEESDDDISKEIVEKHDEEPSKEKMQTEEDSRKSGFFNIFGKKNKKEDVDKIETSESKDNIERDFKTLQLSEKTITDMQNTQNFIHEEITRFEDIRPIITKVTTEDMEDKTEKSEKRKSGIFSGIFTKKDKIDAEDESGPILINQPESLKTSIIFQTDKVGIEKDTEKKVDSIIILQPQSKPDTANDQTEENIVFDEIKKQIVATTDFIKNEVDVYTDVKLIKIEEKIDHHKDDETNIMEDSTLAKDITEKGKVGIFGGLFTKKDKKDVTSDIEKHIKEPKDKGTSPILERKGKSKSPILDKKQISIPPKSINKEKVTNASKLSEAILKQMGETADFLKKEVEVYEDIKIIRSESLGITEQPIAEEEKTEKRKSGIFSGIFAKKDKKDVEDKFGTVSSKDSQSKSQSPKSVRKRTDTSEIALEIYDDVKPIETTKSVLDEIKMTKDEENATKSKVGILSGIFGKKDKKETEEQAENIAIKDQETKSEFHNLEGVNDIVVPKYKESETVIKQMNETADFIRREVDLYEDGKPKVPTIVNAREAAEEKRDKPKVGIFSGIFSNKDKKDVEKEVAVVKESRIKSPSPILDKKETSEQIQFDDSKDILKQMIDTTDFLKKEVELYEDVKLVKPPIVTVEEYKDDKSEKRKSSIFGGIFTKKDKKVSEEEFDQPILKEAQSKPRTPIFSKKDKVITKPVLSDILIKQMTDTTEFLKMEVELYEDGKPPKPIQNFNLEDTIKEKESVSEEFTLTSPKKGIFKIFTKKDKKEESPAATRKEITEEPIQVVVDSGVEEIKLRKKQKNKPRSKSSKDSSESGEESDSSTKKIRFNIFSKKTKAEIKDPIKEAASIESKIGLPDEIVKSMNDTENFLYTEIKNYEDVKLLVSGRQSQDKEEYSETQSNDVKLKHKKNKKQKRDSSESGDESDSATKSKKFKLFGKTKEIPKATITEAPSKEEKLIISEETIKSMNLTTDFIKTELEKYEDGNTFAKSKIEQNITEKRDIQPAEEKKDIHQIEKKKDKKSRFKRDSSESGDESDSSAKKKFSLFGRKGSKRESMEKPIKEAPSKECQLGISELTIKDMEDTHNFLIKEVEYYHDVKPKLKPDDPQDSKVKSNIDQVDDSLKKFIENTNNFISTEIDHYHDVRPVNEDNEVNHVVDIYISDKKVSYDESQEKVKKEVTFMEEAVSKDILDTQSFLATEKEKYTDEDYKVDPILVTTIVFESPEDVIKQSKTVSPPEEHILELDINESSTKEVIEAKIKPEKKKKKGILGKIFSKSKDEGEIDLTDKVSDSIEKNVQEKIILIPKDIEYVDEKETTQSLPSTEELEDSKKKSKGLLGKITTKKGKIDAIKTESQPAKPKGGIFSKIGSKIVTKIDSTLDAVKDTAEPATKLSEEYKNESANEYVDVTTDRGIITESITIVGTKLPKADESKEGLEFTSTDDADSLIPKMVEIKEYLDQTDKDVKESVVQISIDTKDIIVHELKDAKKEESAEEKTKETINVFDLAAKGTKDEASEKVTVLKAESSIVDKIDRAKTIVTDKSIEVKEEILAKLGDIDKKSRDNKKIQETNSAIAMSIGDAICLKQAESINTKDYKDDKTTEEVRHSIDKSDLAAKIIDTKDAATTSKDNILVLKDRVLSNIQDSGETLENITEDYKESAEKMTTGLEKASMDSKDAVEVDIRNTKEAINLKLSDTKDVLDKKGYEVKENLDIIKDAIQTKTSDIADQVKETYADIDKATAYAIENVKNQKDLIGDELISSVNNTKDSLNDVRDGIKTKVVDATDCIESTIKDTRVVLDKGVEEIKEKAIESKEFVQKDFGKMTEEAASDIKSHTKEFKKKIDGKMDESKELLIKKTTDLKEKTKESKQSIGKGIMGFVKSTKDSLVHTKDSLKSKVDKKAKDGKEKLDKKTEHIKNKAKDNIESIQKGAIVAAKTAEGKLDAAKTVAIETVEDGKEKIKDTKHTIDEKREDLMDKAVDTKHKIEDNILGVIQSTKDSLIDSKDKFQSKIEDKKESIGTKIQDTQESIFEKAKDSAHVMDKTIDEKCADIKEKSKATKDNIEKVTKTTVETTLGTLENIKSTINAKTHDSKDVLEQKLLDSKQTIDKAYSGIEDEVKESKEKISKKLEAAQLETKDRIVDIQHAITSKIVDAKDVVSEKTDDTKCTLDKKAEKIKETLSDIKDSIEDKSKGVSFAIRDELVGVKTTISTKYGDFKDNVKGTKAELCQATIDIKDTSEYVIDEFAEGVKEAAISTKDTLIDIKDDVKTNVQKSTDIKIEEIKDAKNKIISDLGEGIQIKQNNLVNIKDAATGKAHEISEKAKGTKDNLKEQTKDTKEIIHGKFKDFKEQIEDTQESVTKEINLTKDSAIKKFEVTKDKAKDATDEIADKVIATSISVEESAVRAKEELGEKIEDLEDTIAHKGDSLKKISEDTKEIIGKQIDIANEKIKQTVKDSKDSFVSKIYDTNESIDNKANDAEKTLEKTATVIKNKALDTKAVIENEFLDKLTETKEDLHKKSQDTKDIIGKTATDITKTVKETKEGLEKDAKSATKSAGGIFSDIKQSLFGKADDAKEKAKETKKALDKKSKDAKEGIIDISENTKNEIKDSIAATKKKIVDVKDDLSEKAIEQKESFCEKVTDTVPMMDKDNEFNKIIINAQEELSAGISDASSTLSKTVDDHIYDITKKAEETKISFIETKDETTKHFKDDLIVNLADKTALDGEKDTIDIIKKQVDSMCVSITEVKDIPIESVKTEVRKDMLLNEDEIENQVRKETAVGSEILMEEIGHKLNDTKDIIQSKYDDIKEVSADTIGERESAIEINIKELEDVTNLSKKEMETGLSDAKASSNDIIGSTTDDKKVVQDKHETIEKDSTYTKDKAKATKASIDTLGSEINPKEDTHCIDDTKKSKGFLGKLSTKLGGKSKSEDKPEQSHKEKEKSKKSKGIFGKVGDKLSQAKDSLIDTKNEGIKSITEKSNETKEDALDIVETKFTNTKDILDSVTKTKESLRDSSEKEKGGINAKQERTMSDIKDPANIIGETTEKKSKMLQIKEIGNEIKDTKYDIKEAAVNLKDNICETYNTKKEEIKTILEKESGILEGEVSKMKDFIDQREINIDRNVEASVSKETVPIASNISEALDKTTDTCEVFDKNISTINEVLIKSESDTIEKKIDIVKSDSPDVLLDLTGIQLQDMKSGISSISEDIKSSMIKLPTFDSKQIETARYAIERENFELKDGSTEIPESIEEKTSKDSEVATKNTGNLNIGLDRIKCAEENIAKKTDDAGKQLQEKPEKSKGLIDDTCVILSDNKVSVDGDTKRKPLFRIESEEDSSEYVTTKRDSINSNILENFSKQKLEALVTDLDIFEDSSLVEPDLSLTERLETKLNDIEKIIESIEKTESELHDEKIEGKLKRVERKFERMASEVIDTEKDEAKASQLTTPEMEEKQDNEFRKVVSQLSREEVSEFQKEYASLWDEQTFSHTDDWDSTKTPDSQAEIIELPQGDIVYMGPVTLNKDNLVNKAGIEVDVIPRMRSPYASPKPKRKKRSKRAKSELGFHSKPKPSEEDRGSLPDLYTNKKGAIMNAILTMSPQRFLSKSTEGHSTISLNYFPKEEHMSQSLGSSESLSKGNIMDAVVHWLNRSSSIDYMNQSYTDTNISICDDDESLESCFLSDRNSFRADNIVPDIFISEDEAFLIYNEPTINKPTTDQLLGEASVSWEQVSSETAKPTKAEKDEASARTPEHSTHVFDQQQLSEETKELLKDMEKDKESKK